jgi:hypothetical protein
MNFKLYLVNLQVKLFTVLLLINPSSYPNILANIKIETSSNRQTMRDRSNILDKRSNFCNKKVDI